MCGGLPYYLCELCTLDSGVHNSVIGKETVSLDKGFSHAISHNSIIYYDGSLRFFFIGPSGLVHQANKATSEIFLQTLSSTQESNLHPFATKNSIIRNLMSKF